MNAVLLLHKIWPDDDKPYLERYWQYSAATQFQVAMMEKYLPLLQ